jgi:hypothetical protein
MARAFFLKNLLTALAVGWFPRGGGIAILVRAVAADLTPNRF